MASQVWQEGMSCLAANSFTGVTDTFIFQKRAGIYHRRNKSKNICDHFWNEQPVPQQNQVLHLEISRQLKDIRDWH